MTVSLRKLIKITAWKSPFGIIKVVLISTLFGDSVFGGYIYITAASLTVSLMLSMRQEIIIHSQKENDLYSTSVARLLLQLVLASCIFFVLGWAVKSPLSLLAILIASTCLTLEDFAKSISDRYGYTLEYEKKTIVANYILPPILYLTLYWYISGNGQPPIADDIVSINVAVSEFLLIMAANTLYLSKAKFFDFSLFVHHFKSLCSSISVDMRSCISNIRQHFIIYRTVYTINYPSAVLSSILSLGSAFWIVKLYGANQLGLYSLIDKILGYLPLFVAANINRKLFIDGMAIMRSDAKVRIMHLYASTFKKSTAILSLITLIIISLYFLVRSFLASAAGFGSNHYEFLRNLDFLSAPPNLIILICITILFRSITKSVSRFTIVGREAFGLLVNLCNSFIPLLVYILATHFSLNFVSAIAFQLSLVIAVLFLQGFLIKHSLHDIQFKC